MAESKEMTIKDYLEGSKDALTRLIPKGLMSADRLITSALNTIAQNEGLRKCTFRSVLECLGTCAQMGLVPGPVMGEAYLIPFEDRKKNQTVCTLMLGYRGMLTLLRRNGGLKSVTCNIYHAKDGWEYSEGMETTLVHRPFLEGHPGEPIAVYCILKFTNGGSQVTVMRKDQVDAIRARSRAGNSGPWVTDYEEMMRKTCVRRAVKLAGMSEEMGVDDGDVIEGSVVQAQAAAALIGSASIRRPPELQSTSVLEMPEMEPEAVDLPAPKGKRMMQVPADGELVKEEGK